MARPDRLVRLQVLLKRYSPECVEEEFSEVPGSNLLRSPPPRYLWGRLRTTFSPQPHPYRHFYSMQEKGFCSNVSRLLTNELPENFHPPDDIDGAYTSSPAIFL